MSSRQALELELARLTERHEEQPAGRVFAPLADCHRKLGQLDAALQICLTGLARHPNYSSAQLILGKIFLDRGEDVAAREAFAKVLELDGQNLLALQHLAGIAERLGDFAEALERWRQLEALEFDPDLAAGKIEQLSGLRDGAVVSPTVEDEGESAAAAEPAREERRVPDFGPATGVTPGHTREIATLTLAGIYAEQGFKAKALEIYRAIAERNPDLPGLRERIQAIESAMANVERNAVEELGGDALGASGGLEIVATAPTQVEEDEGPGVTPSEPLFSDVPSRADPVGRDASRYRRFGSWLERVKSDDED